ncbi:MAG: hypothetical protein JSS61_01855 [Verrucomicrobia bacterium]|nr:hypothetical protein [Verrucomicrobiota bacterium]
MFKHLILFFLLISSFSFADEVPHDEAIVLPAGTVYDGDYFVSGRSVEISGTVDGDLYVFAEQVIIDGTVNGDVIGCGGSFDISGTVAKSCRLLAGQILISGTVKDSITSIGGNVQLRSGAPIGGNVVVVAGNADIAADAASSVTAVASNLRVAGLIHRNLNAYVGQMRITSLARIGGDLDYRSNANARIEPGAQIAGTITHHPSFVRDLVQGTWIHGLLIGSKVLAIAMNFLYTLVVAIILMKLFPRNLDAALSGLSAQPIKALSYGLMLLILLPLAALILLVSVLGVPFALTLIALNIIGFYTAKVYIIAWGSNRYLTKLRLKPNRVSTFFLGLIGYFLVTSIPFIGTFIAFAVMLFGLGAGVLGQARRGVLTGS